MTNLPRNGLGRDYAPGLIGLDIFAARDATESEIAYLRGTDAIGANFAVSIGPAKAEATDISDKSASWLAWGALAVGGALGALWRKYWRR